MPEDNNLKKLVLKSQYIVEEFEETKEKMAKYTEQLYKDFPEEYERMIKAQNSQAAEINTKDGDTTSEEDEFQTSDVIKPPEMRKLYRRISKLTHPDKIQSDFLNSYFKKASSAYSENNISELFTIASFLNVDTSDIDKEEIIRELKSDIYTKQFYINNKKSSLAWRWAHAETEEEKQELRRILKEYTETNY